MLIQAAYEDIRHAVRVGDGFAFSGDGFVSDFIKFWTRSPISHWATVIEALEPERRIKLIESTMLNGKNGVQINYASERIKEKGIRCWWLPLSVESRRKLKPAKFTRFMLAQVGKPYDKHLIAHLLFDKLNLFAAREDWDAFICSELGSAGAKAGGLLPLNTDTSEIVPQRMCEFRLWARDHFQIAGSPKEIRGFNSREV